MWGGHSCPPPLILILISERLPGLVVRHICSTTPLPATCFNTGFTSKRLEKNGEIVATGAGAAALGAPANAVAWLANTLGALGMALRAGEVILSGSLAAMVAVKAGDSLRVSIGGIGGCSVRFV